MDSEGQYSESSSMRGSTEKNLVEAEIKSEEVRTMLKIFFAFCDPTDQGF